MKRRLIVGFLIAVIALTITVPVLAYLYRAPLTIASNYTDYTALPVTCMADVDWMIDNGFITTSTALDTRVETLGGTEQKHMMVEDRIMVFCPTLNGYSQLNWYLTTGNTPLTSFPVVVGDGGYVTISDHANLEVGNNFELEFTDSYIDTGNDLDLVEKEHSIKVYTDNGGTVNAEIYESVNSIEQTTTFTGVHLYSGSITRAGQRVDSYPQGYISQVSFMLTKGGSPTGTAYARVRRVSDDAIVGTLGSVDVSTLGAMAWKDFTTEVYNPTDQNLRFVMEYEGGSAANYIEVEQENSDLCTGSWTYYNAGWTDDGTRDAVIKLYSYPIDVEVSAAVSPGGYNLTVWADGSDFGIDIDGSTEDSTALGGASANGNSNDWIISNIPYCGSYTHTTSSILRITYEPDDVISGTTLPNEENPGTYDGSITWGSNPSGVTAVLGALAVPETTVSVEEEAGGYQGAMREVGVTDWFTEPDVGTRLAASPIRPLVTLMSDYTTITEVQAWRFLGLALLLLITVVAAVMLRGHLLIAGLACGGTIAVLVQQTIWPAWTLVFIIPAIVAGVMAERTPSIG